MISQKKCIFYANFPKGYIPKVTFDVLATNLNRITLMLTKKGIFIRIADDNEKLENAYTMWDINWPKSKFNGVGNYKCTSDKNISLNIKSLQKLIKNVKKKDSLVFYISEAEKTWLNIIIQPNSSQNSSNLGTRTETVRLNIQYVDFISPKLPDTYDDINGNKKNAYSSPMIIKAPDFQKIKKMISMCKTTIIVTIQKNNYIRFSTESNGMTGLCLEVGALTMTPESDDEEEDDDAENCKKITLNDSTSEESDDKKNKDSESEEDEESSEKSQSENYPKVYQKQFNVNLFSPLVKLPGLCEQMEFFAPLFDSFPLKVSVNASHDSGTISVYLKDTQQIELIEKNKT
jgi:Proliferating cell nuclear antigen, N-terminal domain